MRPRLPGKANANVVQPYCPDTKAGFSEHSLLKFPHDRLCDAPHCQRQRPHQSGRALPLDDLYRRNLHVLENIAQAAPVPARSSRIARRNFRTGMPAPVGEAGGQLRVAVFPYDVGASNICGCPGRRNVPPAGISEPHHIQRGVPIPITRAGGNRRIFECSVRQRIHRVCDDERHPLPVPASRFPVHDASGTPRMSSRQDRCASRRVLVGSGRDDNHDRRLTRSSVSARRMRTAMQTAMPWFDGFIASRRALSIDIDQDDLWRIGLPPSARRPT